jgi:hypothetical protein
MPFSTTIADKILVACGRSCCICHRFCGTKIELHHIVPEAQNGPNTEENCIPVCFDCHAEVEHYNPKHPKGRKFTPNELKGHRDKWFAKVMAGSSGTDNETLRNVDRQMFDIVRSILTNEGLYYIRNRDFHGFGYWERQRKDIFEFELWADDPSHEFFDPDLEALKVGLYKAIREFRGVVSVNTWIVTGEGDDTYYAVPHEWEFEQPKRYRDAAKDMREAAILVCECYDNFIRTGRKKLGVL